MSTFFFMSLVSQKKLLYFHTGQVYICVCVHIQNTDVGIKDVTAAPHVRLLCVESAQFISKVEDDR